MDLIKQLNWRYATKRMTGQKIPSERISRILEAINLSASSLGLQPYTIFVISNPELKSKIQSIAFNQQQVSASSHLLVFASWDNLSEDRIDAYFERVKEVRGNYPENMKTWKDMLLGKIKTNSAEDNFNWLARQAYIALGTALACAAVEEIDSTPMEGFNPKQLDELLELPSKNLRSVLIMPLGYRDIENDYLVNLPKVRKEMDDLFIHMT